MVEQFHTEIFDELKTTTNRPSDDTSMMDEKHVGGKRSRNSKIFRAIKIREGLLEADDTGGFSFESVNLSLDEGSENGDFSAYPNLSRKTAYSERKDSLESCTNEEVECFEYGAELAPA